MDSVPVSCCWAAEKLRDADLVGGVDGRSLPCGSDQIVLGKEDI
jgi:hypothetical protein